MRRSSLDSVNVAIAAKIDSKYDHVELVSDNIADVVILSTAITNGDLTNAINITNMVVAVGTEGSVATWDGTTLTIPVGATGSTGTTGAQGIQGEIGTQGVVGSKGDTGNSLTLSGVVDNTDGTFTWSFSDGNTFTTSDLTGSQGPIGPNGVQGVTGSTGVQGSVGSTGLTGSQGNTGLTGKGFTAGSYNVVNGTVKFLSADGIGFVTGDLRGAQGEKGDIGIDGIGWSGPTGPRGDEGDVGPLGPVGLKGDTGLMPVYAFSIVNGNVVATITGYTEPADTVEWSA
jgi:collagen type VII alpha